MSSTPLLVIRDLRVSFATAAGDVQAVDGVSVELEVGQILGVVGESGCGKTVLALTVMGLIEPPGHVSGSVQLDGLELVGAPEDRYNTIRGSRVGMIFQQPNLSLNPVMTVGRQIEEALPGGMRRTARRRRSVELLGEVGLADPARRSGEYAHQFSGGMAQRAMIAIALAGEPALLIADEPTTALDATVQAQIIELLERLCAERHLAMMLISHDLELVASTAHRVAVMYAGRIVEDGDIDAVYDRTRHPYTRALLQARPGGVVEDGRLRVITGSVPIPIDLPPGCSFAPRCTERAGRTDCVQCAPDRTEPEPGHGVRCFLYV